LLASIALSSAQADCILMGNRNLCWFRYAWRSRKSCPACCLRWPVLGAAEVKPRPRKYRGGSVFKSTAQWSRKWNSYHSAPYKQSRDSECMASKLVQWGSRLEPWTDYSVHKSSRYTVCVATRCSWLLFR